ncbi:MAG: ribosomal subunit interface protein [Candidatus Yonathbacteria bacterium RIFCSPHIGHO2_01_FULL_51_10]|uniref:Ribosomal subunit interface protein n=1 Tax=Candidatus Yonathbacteria bacterium RIFCSPHIGHO2_01_FULL_51_10 TaxID=1802723 RepID=A0A1G2S7Y4_9BACT|nr:MAG: ribosomal subunit interface protein [Candidatus Yonathbacteria bacterium RIFCSPHIGHO2_01_FULL_51_10]
MNISIKTTGIEPTDALTKYVTEKMGAAAKFLRADEAGNSSAQVEIGKTTKHHQSGNVFRAEVNVRMNGTTFRAVSEQEDLYAAIDDMKDELVREITSAKDKRQTLIRRGGAMVKKFMRGFGGKE